MEAMWTMMNSRAVIDSARRRAATRGSLSSAFAFASSVSACLPRFSAESPSAGSLATSAERRRAAAEALRTFSVVRRKAFIAWSSAVLKRVPAAKAGAARSRKASVAVRGMEPPVEGARPAYHKHLAASGRVMARWRPHAQDRPAPLPGAVIRRARAGRSRLPVPAEPHPDPLLGPRAAHLDPRHSGRKRGAGDALGPRIPRAPLGRRRQPGGRARRRRGTGLRSAPLARRQERRIRARRRAVGRQAGRRARAADHRRRHRARHPRRSRVRRPGGAAQVHRVVVVGGFSLAGLGRGRLDRRGEALDRRRRASGEAGGRQSVPAPGEAERGDPLRRHQRRGRADDLDQGGQEVGVRRPGRVAVRRAPDARAALARPEGPGAGLGGPEERQDPHSGEFSRDSTVWVRIVSSRTGQVRHEVLRGGTSLGELPAINEAYPFLPRVEIKKVGPAPGFFASVVRPRDFDARKKYPVWVQVYGGPTGPLVVPFAARYVLDQWIADHGYIVVRIDNRGTTGRGHAWERAILGRFAQVPLDDQVAALQALAKLEPAMDLGRVGIYGHSFGGFMSALAVARRPEVFRVGVASAPVVDWMNYDTAYTERYLGVPPPAGTADDYPRNGLLAYAKDLSRPLLIIHGTADDNVHFSESLLLADTLFRAGKKFEFLPLAGMSHTIADPALQARDWQRVFAFFDQHLRREP